MNTIHSLDHPDTSNEKGTRTWTIRIFEMNVLKSDLFYLKASDLVGHRKEAIKKQLATCSSPIAQMRAMNII